MSLSGWYMRDEIEGMRCWTGGLHLSSTADGIAFEGYVAGKLIAASPVQVCSLLSHVFHLLFLHTLTGGFCLRFLSGGWSPQTPSQQLEQFIWLSAFVMDVE